MWIVDKFGDLVNLNLYHEVSLSHTSKPVGNDYETAYEVHATHHGAHTHTNTLFSSKSEGEAKEYIEALTQKIVNKNVQGMSTK